MPGTVAFIRSKANVPTVLITLARQLLYFTQKIFIQYSSPGLRRMCKIIKFSARPQIQNSDKHTSWISHYPHKALQLIPPPPPIIVNDRHLWASKARGGGGKRADRWPGKWLFTRMSNIGHEINFVNYGIMTLKVLPAIPYLKSDQIKYSSMNHYFLLLMNTTAKRELSVFILMFLKIAS